MNHRSHISFHQSHMNLPTPLTTDLLNNSSSFLNLSFHDKTRLSFLAATNDTQTNGATSKDTSRSNTTIRHKAMLSDKENLSPIKKGLFEKKQAFQAPWFLKQVKISNRGSISNKTNYARASLKGGFNGCDNKMSEGEKLTLTLKRLEEDVKKEILDYDAGLKSLKRQRDYLEKRQKALQQDLESTIKAYKCEEDIEDLVIKGDECHRSEGLIKTHEKLAEILKKVNSSDKYIISLKDNPLIRSFEVFLQEKRELIEKLYEEEGYMRLIKERRHMTYEDYNSLQVKIIEWAFEYEDLEECIEEIRKVYGNETNEIEKEVDFIEKNKEIKEILQQNKVKIMGLEKEKSNLEIKIHNIKGELDVLNKKLYSLRQMKGNLKMKEIHWENEKKNIVNELDETGQEAFFQYLSLFDEKISNKNKDYKDILFLCQNIVIDELKAFEDGMLDQMKLKEIEKKKSELLDIKEENEILKVFFTICYMNEQIYLNLISGIQGDIDHKNHIFNDIIRLLIAKKETFQGFFQNISDLQIASQEYQSVSGLLLQYQSNFSRILKELSNLYREMNTNKELLKDLETKRHMEFKNNQEAFIQGTEEMMAIFMENQKDMIKDIKFKYGKEYLQKYQFEIEREFKSQNKDQKEKLKYKILGLFLRRKELENVRRNALDRINNSISTEIQKLDEDFDEIHAKISVLKQRMKELLIKEKGFNMSIENKLFEGFNKKDQENELLIKEMIIDHRREVVRSYEAFGMSEKNADYGELTPLMRMKLLEEKGKGLEEELEELKKKEFKGLEEMETVIKEKEERIQEKHQRIEILKEYIKKNIIVDTKLNKEDNKENINNKEIIRGNNSNKCNILSNNHRIRVDTNTTINKDNRESFYTNNNNNCNNMNDESQILQISQISQISQKNKNTKEGRHAASKSFIGNFPAKFGLVTIELNEKALNMSNNLNNNITQITLNNEEYIKKPEIQGISLFKRLSKTTTAVKPYDSRQGMQGIEKLGFTKTILKFQGKFLEFYTETSQKDLILDIRLNIKEVKKFLINTEFDCIIKEKRREKSCSDKRMRLAGVIKKEKKLCYIFSLDIGELGVIECIIENEAEFLLIRDHFKAIGVRK